MPAAPDAGLRERKKRETRAALSLAATRLCVTRGWEHTTVDDIAAAANVSPRTFRNYFSNKAEAVAAGHLERMLRISDQLRRRPANEPLWEAILNAVTLEFQPGLQASGQTRDVTRWREQIRFVVTEPAIRAEVLKATAEGQTELAKAIAERTATHERDLYPQVAAAVAAAAMDVAMWQWLRADPTRSVLPLLRKAFDLITAGLPAPRSKSRSLGR